jgi:hypothetical protein
MFLGGQRIGSVARINRQSENSTYPLDESRSILTAWNLRSSACRQTLAACPSGRIGSRPTNGYPFRSLDYTEGMHCGRFRGNTLRSFSVRRSWPPRGSPQAVLYPTPRPAFIHPDHRSRFPCKPCPSINSPAIAGPSFPSAFRKPALASLVPNVAKPSQSRALGN